MPREILKDETKAQYTERRNKELLAEAKQRKIDLKDGKIEVVLDVDDMGYLLPGMDDLLRLKKSFPGLKITCFTIPLPKEFYDQKNSKQFTWEKYEKWAKIVNSYDWIEVAFHGFSHTHHECDCSYEKAVETIKAAENVFKRVGLEYVKIWRAPYWQTSYSFLTALRDMGYVAALDRNHPRPAPEGLEIYYYNWSINEPIIFGGTVLGHSHFGGNCNNIINQHLPNVLREIPTSAKFITLSEYVKRETSQLADSDDTGGQTA